MNTLYPIIRRKRRPLIPPEEPKPPVVTELSEELAKSDEPKIAISKNTALDDAKE
ncbi:MAG: hypothetical protein ABIQ35_11250 [Verrucomicrobiota bacterium]